MPAEGTAAFVPSVVPDGWTLGSRGAGSRRENAPEHLAALRRRRPVAAGTRRRARVAPCRDQYRSSAARPRTRCRAARPVPDDQPPSRAVRGAFELEWADGDLFHDVIAVGMSEAELLHFLGTLVPDDDPAAGFHAPPGSALPQLDVATLDGAAYYAPYLRYASPSGDQAVTVYTTQPAYTRRPDLPARRERRGRRPGHPGRRLAPVRVAADRPTAGRSRRWPRTASRTPPGSRRSTASAEPATRQQVVDLVATQPVTATETVGEWTVEVRGNGVADLALCLTPAGGAATCTTAQTLPGGPGADRGSALVDGEWVVVVLTLGSEPALVETTTAGPEGVAEEMPETLEGERRQVGDRVIEVVTVPAGVEAVSATVPSGRDADEPSTGLGYSRPGADAHPPHRRGPAPPGRVRSREPGSPRGRPPRWGASARSRCPAGAGSPSGSPPGRAR